MRFCFAVRAFEGASIDLVFQINLLEDATLHRSVCEIFGPRRDCCPDLSVFSRNTRNPFEHCFPCFVGMRRNESADDIKGNRIWPSFSFAGKTLCPLEVVNDEADPASLEMHPLLA